MSRDWNANPPETTKDLHDEGFDEGVATAVALIKQHIPSLSDADDVLIHERLTELLIYTNEDRDIADLAIRTCACGAKIDGFYEYSEHLIKVLGGNE